MNLHVDLINRGPLSKREGEILIHLGAGQTREQIADELHRSRHTISRHVEHIAEKLHAHNQTEIVASAIARHLIEILNTSD